MPEPIAVLCPSRDRTEDFLGLCASFVETSESARLYAYVDDDQRAMYEALTLPERVTLHFGPQVGPTASVNALAVAFPGHQVYGVAPDDTRFATIGWDSWVLSEVEKMPKRLGVISPAHPHGAFVNFPYVTREWIDLLGWFAEPTPFHFVWDTILEMLGDATRIVYATKEQFFMHNDAKLPTNYAQHFHTDCEKFLWWCVIERRTLVQKIRERIAS